MSWLNQEEYFCASCGFVYTEERMAHIYKEIGICKECAKEIYTTKDMTFEGKKYIDFVIAPFLYSGSMTYVIKSFKFRGQRLFGKLLGNMLTEKLQNTTLLQGFDMIVPVPLHKKRLQKRGYNQSDIIADFVGSKFNIPVEKNALIRVKNTKHQSRLDGADRIENVRDAFVANDEVVYGKNIILIDDIYTMGETANECGKALKSAGAGKVIAVTVCKTIVNKKAILT